MVSGKISGKIISAKYVSRPENSKKPHTVRWWDAAGQHEKSFATDREAIDARDRMLADGKRPVANVTFAEAFEMWIAAKRIKPGTQRRYRSVYSAHLAVLGSRKLADVATDPNGLRSLAKVEAGKVVLGIVCGVATWAQTGGMITDNRIPRAAFTGEHGTVRRVRQHVPYSADQLRVIVDYLGQDGIIARILNETGCRVSEALALRVEDFNGEPGRHSVTIARQRDRETGRDVDLKVSGKSHSVPVSDTLYLAVCGYSGALTESSYGRFAGRLRLACERAGVYFSAHNFRHDYALRETVQATYLNHTDPRSEAIVRAALN
jgi:integrase